MANSAGTLIAGPQGASTPTPVDIQIFTAQSATWTKPAGATYCRITVIAAGGGGDPGNRNAAAIARSGGGGGGGGGASTNGANSGAGGNGGDGFVVITTWF
mgnify:CR=1 FL=1